MLESINMYSPRSGITNNISESFNHLLKTVVRPKLPSDLMLLAFYELAAHSLIEIKRGCAQVGNYYLKPEYANQQKEKSSLDKGNVITDINNFVRLLKQALNNGSKPTHTKSEQPLKYENESEKNEDTDHTYTFKHNKDDTVISNASSKVLAELALAENRVFFMEQTKCYIVLNRKRDPYAVRLSPDRCLCPSTTTCYHIFAAQMLAGNYSEPEKRTLNLSLLRKRARKREEHRSIGKKKPRLELEDIVPAPDSQIVQDGPAETCILDDSCSIMDFTPTNEESSVSECKSVMDSSFIEKEENTEITKKKNINRLSLGHKKRYWIAELSLPWTEKKYIIGDQTLTCDSMHAAQKIVKSQFPFVGGLQDTGYVPIFNDKKNKWHYQSPMLPIAMKTVAQIHHTGQFHWVLSTKYNDKVYIFDSMFHLKTPLSPSLQIQLCNIYANKGHILNVYLPYYNQQTNGLDCGVFAIANLINFCFSIKNEDESIFTNEFDIDSMRRHLIAGFEAKKFKKFPLGKTNVPKKFHKVSIPIDCIHCEQPNVFEDMLQCDRCQKWMHYSCALVEVHRPTPERWWCNNCKT